MPLVSEKDRTLSFQKNNPRISLIATFYNLEDCIDYCLKSVLAQEFSDYELLCIDDGSSDTTFAKLMEYADHPKVRIVHQANGGLSQARNTGVRYARGEFVSFIDGDDIVSPFYLSSLYEALMNDHADLAIGTLEFTPASEIDAAADSWEKPTHRHVLRNTRAIEEVLCHKRDVTGCVKLAPKTVYSDSFFPVGLFHEDLYTVADVFEKTPSIVVVDDVIYKYIQRGGSITHNSRNLNKRSSDLVHAVNHISEVSSAAGIDQSYIELYRCFACLRLHNNGGKYIDSKALQGYVRDHLSQALSCPEAHKIDRFTLKLFAFNLKLYDLVRKLKLKVLPNNNEA